MSKAAPIAACSYNEVTNWDKTPKTTLEPCGHRVIIKPRNVEDITEGGILLPDQTKEMDKRATQEATVIAVGPQAFKSQGIAAGDEKFVPWCKSGDVVEFSRYSGHQSSDYIVREMGYNPKVDRIITVNDDDIINVIRRG